MCTPHLNCGLGPFSVNLLLGKNALCLCVFVFLLQLFEQRYPETFLIQKEGICFCYSLSKLTNLPKLWRKINQNLLKGKEGLKLTLNSSSVNRFSKKTKASE